ncbi:expressed unknown protein [Seminavis robusta]|uniref:Uncharacterized protein n=1 Tax=Seminavis robusta TaxID=568900 RepID=A0A9N8HYG1_9STRA|nr:expressed unknown protein [Seminavis robusta]|eukprot:Sro2876_g339170.1 n/a (456) ;mRNA; r:8505-9872
MSYQEAQDERCPEASMLESIDEVGSGNESLLNDDENVGSEDRFASGTVASASSASRRMLVSNTSVTTEGSVYGGSRSSRCQDRPVIADRTTRTRHEREHHRQPRAPTTQQRTPTSQGFEKLEAYVYPNDENAVPFEAQSASKLSLEEDFSLHLSRTTGTGSQQLAMWIKEVNLAVGKVPSKLTVQTDVRTVEKTVAGVPPRSRSALSPANRNDRRAFSPANNSKSDYPRQRLFQQREPSFSPTKKRGSDISSAKAQWHEKCQAHEKHRPPPVPSPARSATSTTRGATAARSITPIHAPSPGRSSTTSAESNLLLASIEGQYKNLREDLIRESTLEEPQSLSDSDSKIEEPEPIEEEEEIDEGSRSESAVESCCRKPRNRRNHSRSKGAANAKSSKPFRSYEPPIEFPRDRFSLGMLSTRSSGILSANSWSSNASSISGISVTYPGGKSCGLFLCD